MADVVISNCVINLSPDKPRVFREAFRALSGGGRLMVSDIVLMRDLPEPIRNSMEAYAACIAGASSKEDYLGAIEAAGFIDVEVLDETVYPTEWLLADSTLAQLVEKTKAAGIADDGRPYAASIKVTALKPGIREKRPAVDGCC